MFDKETHISRLETFLSQNYSGSVHGGLSVRGLFSNSSKTKSIREESSIPQMDAMCPTEDEPMLRSCPCEPVPTANANKASEESSIDSKKVEKVRSKEPVSSSISSFLSKHFEDSAVARKLNYYMHAKDITTAMIYERCYIDRKLISKITNRSNYHPSKNTMLALCIGLRLTINEAEEFVSLAGYSFSNTSKFDLIIQYMLINEIFDLYFINEMLEKYDQPLLGA